jgi:hypothetical protein
VFSAKLGQSPAGAAAAPIADADGDGVADGGVITVDEVNKRVGINKPVPAVTYDISRPTGPCQLWIGNATDGASEFAGLELQHGGLYSSGALYGFGSNYTSGGTGALQANRMAMYANRAGGAAVVAAHASGGFRVWTGGLAAANLRLTINEAGAATFGGTVSLAADPVSALQAVTKRYADRIVDVQLLGSAQTSVTFSSLAGNTDEGYELFAAIKNAAGDAVQLSFNGGTGTVRYHLMYGQASVSVVTSALMGMVAGGFARLALEMDARAHDGVIRMGTHRAAAVNASGVFNDNIAGSFSWNDGSSQTLQVTSITLTASAASGFAAGSWFALLRKKLS